MARAEIVLETRQSALHPGTQRVLSDTSGQFSFSSLPAGTYVLRVEKRGYATAEYGQRSTGEPGTPIVIGDEDGFQALVGLQKLGAIMGQVVDENGIGLPDVTVSAYRAGGRPRQVAAARTDDRGIFRLAGLDPGSYLVRTSAKRLEDGLDLMPTYYPEATSATDAQRVEVQLDDEADALTLAPRTGKLAEVTGTFGANGTVWLISDYSLREANSQLGAHFRFESVEPGTYTVVAVSANGAHAGYKEITVGSEDAVADLELSTMPQLRLRCEIAEGQHADVEAVSFYFRRTEDTDDNPHRLFCGETAAFPPGHWRVAAIPPANLYVARILESGTGADIQELLLKPGESRELSITLGSSPATLSGKVSTADGDPAIGAPVYLRGVGADLQRRVGGVRETRVGPDGIYRILGLPPGRYELLSSFHMNDAENDPWPSGYPKIVDLEEGQSENLDLTLTTAH